MSRWWRAYDEAVDDPKLIGLSDEQHRFWFNILCVCSAFGGSLPDVRTISIKLRMQPRKVVRLLNDLREAGLLDESNGLITPHNWQSRQYKSDSSVTRVKRYRERRRSVSGNVSVTPPETENREQRTEKSSEAYASAADAAASATTDFDEIPGFLHRPQIVEHDVGLTDVEVVDEDPKAKLFRLGKTILVSFGVAEKRTGGLIGQWLKARDDPAGILAAIQFARDQNVAEPVAYVSAVIHGKQKNGASNGHANDRQPGESLEAYCARLADAARELERAAGDRRPDEPFRSH